jgi:orotate phosphoribosyltransferase
MSATDPLTDYEFLDFALQKEALLLGSFMTKAGRLSPYFFNTGKFSDGESLLRLSRAYCRALLNSGLQFDMLFGPAYKGITLAAALAMALAEHGHNVPYVYNRKEAKEHGEGGVLVGPALAGRVLIVDDVISAGTSVNESVALIRGAGATVAGVIIAVDRQERGGTAEALTDRSAAQEVTARFGIPVIAVTSLTAVLDFVRDKEGIGPEQVAAIAAYCDRYGAV